MRNTKSAAGAAFALALLLGGCSLAPPLETPEIPVAANYKEGGPWIEAQPADHLPRGAWWRLYAEPELDALQDQLIANSPNLAAAVARYNQAEAYTAQLRSGLFPVVDAVGSIERNRQSDRRPLRNANTGQSEYSDYSVGVQAAYEIDLWGRVRNSVAAGTAAAEAERADLESTRLSLQAQLAEHYILLRGLDQQIALLLDMVEAFGKTLELTQVRHEGGIAPSLDVARARTQYESARSRVEQTLAQRAVAEHAIAALVGAPVSAFSIAPRTEEIAVPAIPVGIPSTLLQRRPDIAAAQRRMAAANASIGVARAAYFPNLTLGAVFGFQSGTAGSLISAPARFWAIGPTAVLNLFDYGRRRANEAQAQALLDETSAQYRAVAINAFQQVEDNLALINHYGNAATSQQAAADAALASLDFSTTRYREGASSYLDVTVSQTAALEAQQDLVELNTRKLQASVQLIRALGGGWSAKAFDLNAAGSQQERQGSSQWAH